MSNICERALEAVVERGNDYGTPSDNHGCSAELLTAFLKRKYGFNHKLDAEDICLFMILMKVSRLSNVYHEDSVVDIAGYALNLETVHNKKEDEGRFLSRKKLVEHGVIAAPDPEWNLDKQVEFADDIAAARQIV